MKKHPAAYKKYVNELARELRWQFFMDEYTLRVKFHDSVARNPDWASSASRDSSVVASMDIDSVYLQLTLTVTDEVFEAWKMKRYKFILESMVHEFSHVITEPLYILGCRAVAMASRPELEDIRERQTQRITNVWMRTIPADVKKLSKLSHAKDLSK